MNKEKVSMPATEVPPDELVTMELDTSNLTETQQMMLSIVMGEGALQERDRTVAIVQTSDYLSEEQKERLLREIIPQRTETEGED